MPKEYEFQTQVLPVRTLKHQTQWMVRELRDGKPWGKWRRLHMTPRGKYYLMSHEDGRVDYDGPVPS